jgi:hypothetical protein
MNDMDNMDNIGDEHLQHQAEKNQFGGGDKDSRAYRLVFDTLRREPSFRLSSGFSDAILRRTENAEGRTQYYWFAFAIAGFFITAGVAIALTGFSPDFGFLKHISKFTGLFIFGTAFIILLHWIDKKLIHGKSAGI